MKRNTNVLGLIIVGLTVVSLAGCDMFASVTGSMKKKETAAAPQQQPAATPPPPAPAPKPAPQANPQPQKPKPLSGNEIARVGEWRMTLDEFNERISAVQEVMPGFDATDPQAKKLILEELVRQQLLVEYAEEAGIAKDPDVVAALDEFRRTLLVREAAMRLTEDIQVSDEEAMAFYEERKDQIVQPTEFRVREIVVEDKVKANELLVEILKGSDFIDLAKSNSIGDTAAQGGDLGYITEEPFFEMAEQILALQPGETSNVFRGPKGFYIIKLEDVRGGGPIPFEEVKEEVVSSQLLLKQQEVILEQIEKVKQKTPVEVKEELLN